MRKFSTRRLISHRLNKKQHARALRQQKYFPYFYIFKITSIKQFLLLNILETDSKQLATLNVTTTPCCKENIQIYKYEIRSDGSSAAAAGEGAATLTFCNWSHIIPFSSHSE